VYDNATYRARAVPAGACSKSGWYDRAMDSMKPTAVFMEVPEGMRRCS